MAVTYTAHPRRGLGRATKMHSRRGPTLSSICGTQIQPGTLNLSLDRPFDWSGAVPAIIPDACSWSHLDGLWQISSARVAAVRLDDTPAWAVRLDRSGAPDTLVELVAAVILRDEITRWPATLEAL